MPVLKKLSDDKFGGNHPNNINEGFVESGHLWVKPEVGSSCCVGDTRTSTVTEILESNQSRTVFKTLNSTYELTH